MERTGTGGTSRAAVSPGRWPVSFQRGAPGEAYTWQDPRRGSWGILSPFLYLLPLGLGSTLLIPKHAPAAAVPLGLFPHTVLGRLGMLGAGQREDQHAQASSRPFQLTGFPRE